jgi:hypothetical protein
MFLLTLDCRQGAEQQTAYSLSSKLLFKRSAGKLQLKLQPPSAELQGWSTVHQYNGMNFFGQTLLYFSGQMIEIASSMVRNFSSCANNNLLMLSPDSKIATFLC